MTTTTWSDLFAILADRGSLPLKERPSQRAFGDAVQRVVTEGGTLICEAPVGVGKSAGYLLPLVHAVKHKKRSVISTETTALQDQLVDKDLPWLEDVFGGFEFTALKGRSWYLCCNRAPESNPVLARLRGKNLGNGERRDIERVLRAHLSDDDWGEISGDADYCAQKKCQPEKCYSARARQKALDADIVVTNHALLMTDAEYGILGDYHHLVVDEAHTLEKVLIDGWTFELSPYDMWKNMESVWKGIDAAYMSEWVPRIEEADRLMKTGTKSIVKLFTLLAGPTDETEWRRSSYALSEKYLSGAQSQAVISALEEYELQGPGRFTAASEIFNDLSEALKKHLETMESGKRKVGKGASAAKRLSKTLSIMGEALQTRNGIVMRYGIPYAVLADGWKAYKGERDVRIRCVPLDVSGEAREALWRDRKSVTLVSGTLRDETDGSFRYVKSSLGLPAEAQELIVGSSFDYNRQQLVYVTDGRYEPVQVPGAQYSFDELLEVLRATSGRALVLFTANVEMEYAADSLRQLRAAGEFPHRVLVQERGVSKSELVRAFMDETDSVLLGSKSFFTGVDFPGESCSVVVLAKFPLPQYNALCRAQIDWWKKKGFPRWYEREALQVFKQANGRLIRNETDRGVIVVLDQRVANKNERVSVLTGMEVTATGSAMTTSLEEVRKWLHT